MRRNIFLIPLVLAFALLLFAWIGAHEQERIRLPQPNRPDIDGATVTWNDVDHAIGYCLRWRTHGAEDWLHTVDAGSQTHYTLPVDQADVVYEVQVQALGNERDHHHSEWSETALLTSLSPTPVPSSTLTITLTPAATATSIPYDKLSLSELYELYLQVKARADEAKARADAEQERYERAVLSYLALGGVIAADFPWRAHRLCRTHLQKGAGVPIIP